MVTYADADLRLRPARPKVVHNEIVKRSVNKFKQCIGLERGGGGKVFPGPAMFGGLRHSKILKKIVSDSFFLMAASNMHNIHFRRILLGELTTLPAPLYKSGGEGTSVIPRFLPLDARCRRLRHLDLSNCNYQCQVPRICGFGLKQNLEPKAAVGLHDDVQSEFSRNFFFYNFCPFAAPRL